VRLLSPESVSQMGQNQIGELELRPIASLIPQFITSGVLLPGSLDRFGLGFALNTQPVPGGRAALTMSWAGVFNTYFWVDRENQVCGVVLSQMLPFGDPGPLALVEAFDRAVYAERGEKKAESR